MALIAGKRVAVVGGGNVALDAAFLKRALEKEKPYLVYSLPVAAGRWEAMMALLD